MSTANEHDTKHEGGFGRPPTHSAAAFLAELDPQTPVDEIGRLWEEQESEFELGGAE